MTRLEFTAKWLLIFIVLYYFSVQSVIGPGILTPPTAYAEAILSNSDMQKSEHFVTLKGKKRTLCAISQSQLNLLKSRYKVTIKHITVDGKIFSVAEVDNQESSPNSIYRLLGLPSSGQYKCVIIKEDRAFYLLLVPGVS